MPTPLFALRLAEKTQADLREMAKVYGAPNASAFAREVLEVMCSGDNARVRDFIKRLSAGMGEQLALQLAPPEPKERQVRRKRTLRKKRKPRNGGRRGTT